MIAKLPANATATDVIDLVADGVMEIVEEVNAGRTLTRLEFMAAFNRAFPLALARFLGELDAKRPELAQRIRTDFLTEEQERRAARH